MGAWRWAGSGEAVCAWLWAAHQPDGGEGEDCLHLHWNSFNTELPGSDWDCGLRATLCPLCQLMV